MIMYHPQKHPDYIQEIDNISALSTLKNILYVKLVYYQEHAPEKWEVMGILQLVNKKNGLSISKEDDLFIWKVSRAFGTAIKNADMFH